MITHLFGCLAQLAPAAGDAPATDAVDKPAAGGGFGTFDLMFMLIMGTLLMMLLFRPRKADRELKERLAALKKNDRVVTVGGIIGTVMSIRDDNNTVTLRIDEATNTKIQVLKTAIGRVLNEEKPSGTES